MYQTRSPFHELNEGIFHVDGSAAEEARPVRVEVDGFPALAVHEIAGECALQQAIVRVADLQFMIKNPTHQNSFSELEVQYPNSN